MKSTTVTNQSTPGPRRCPSWVMPAQDPTTSSVSVGSTPVGGGSQEKNTAGRSWNPVTHPTPPGTTR